jgi:hypothetical protein
MSLVERSEYQIEVIPPFKVLNCRRSDIIERDGVEISRAYHRHTKVPGDDMTSEPPEMQVIAAALWTPEVIAAYQAGQPLPPEPPEPGPDYMAFWDALLVSGVYQSIRAQAVTTPAVLVACTEFIAAIGDAKMGRPNVMAIQACIYYLLAAGTFTEAELQELGALLVAGNLQDTYVLAPPAP